MLIYFNSSHPGQNGCHFVGEIFKCLFMKEKFHILFSITSKFSQWVNIGSVNGLALNRQQANTWTNDDPVHWHISAALGKDEVSNMKTNINFINSWHWDFQVVEIFPSGGLCSVYLTWSMPWLLMIQQSKETKHHQPQYWLHHRIFWLFECQTA